MALPFVSHLLSTIKALLLLVVVFSYVNGFSQDETFSAPGKKKESDQDVYNTAVEKPYKYNKVMVIPYRPDMHVSDADPELCKATELSVDEIHKLFRMELDYGVTARIMPIYKTRPILRAQTEDDLTALDDIYAKVSYKYDDVQPPNYEAIIKEKKTIKDKINEKFSLKKDTEDQESTQTDPVAHDYIMRTGDDQYMNAHIRDTALLPRLEEEYGTDLFVFLNQFEIKTLSKSCYDLQNKNYVREVKVHFSVYDSQGRQISGDVISVIAETSSNDIQEIVHKSYPAITEEITEYLPNPKKTVNEIFREKAKERQKEAAKKAKLAKKEREKNIHETGQLR